MDKYAILLGYFDKQQAIIQKLQNDVIHLDLSTWENGYVFALKTQQLFTALEDLFKQTAKAFENHIEDLGYYHRELLVRMNTAIPNIRPAVLSNESLILLDKLRAFRHFVRHGYGCELNEKELSILQESLRSQYQPVVNDLKVFRQYIIKLSST